MLARTPFTHPTPLLSVASSVILATGLIHAQGTLEPPSAPAPSMKSLQQIWDKISTLESTVVSQQQLLALQSEQLDTQAKMLADIGADSGSLWDYVDTGLPATGVLDIEFLPSGQLALLTWDATDLEFHVEETDRWHTTPVLSQSVAYDANLIAGSDGRLHLTFLKHVDVEDDGLYQRIRSAAGIWSDPAPLGPRIRQPNFNLASAVGTGNRTAHVHTNAENAALVIFWSDGTDSYDQIIETNTAFTDPARYLSTSVSFNPATGYPEVAYQLDVWSPDRTPTVRHATYDGTAWRTQRIDNGVTTAHSTTRYPSLAINPITAQPAVIFRSSVINADNTVTQFYTLAMRTPGSTWIHERYNGYLPWQSTPDEPQGPGSSDMVLAAAKLHFLPDGTALASLTRQFFSQRSSRDLILARRAPDGARENYIVVDDPTDTSGTRAASFEVSPDGLAVFAFVPETTQTVHLAISRLPFTR